MQVLGDVGHRAEVHCAYQVLSVQAQMLKEFLVRSAVGGMFIIAESEMCWGLGRGLHVKCSGGH